MLTGGLAPPPGGLLSTGALKYARSRVPGTFLVSDRAGTYGSGQRAPTFPYPEDLLQFIWEQQLFDRRDLRATDGRPVEVLRAGRIQHHGGPDLIDARIRIAGQEWAGAVEVHVRAGEWYAHGHQHDPAYDGVVLHVVHQEDRPVRTSAGRLLPTVELGPRIPEERLAAYRRLMSARSWVPCAGELHRTDRHRNTIWLERLAVERLERRSLDIAIHLRELAGDADELLHHLLLRALGLGVNGEAFAQLARRIPWRLLARYREDDLRLEALLLGQAGLLGDTFQEELPRRWQAEHAHLARLHGLEPMPKATWKFARMRPVNLPTVRLAQYAALVRRSEGSLVRLLNEEGTDRLEQQLKVLPSAYWLDHHVPGRPSVPSPKPLGSQSAQRLIVNALVPAAFALGRSQGREALCDRALGWLEQLPAERNGVLERWTSLGLAAQSAAQGQALLELRARYCTPRRCLSCSIGNQLLGRSLCQGSTHHQVP